MKKTFFKDELHPNDPRAGHLYESMRHSGYANIEAIADIVDNCIDEDAYNIWIDIEGSVQDNDVVIRIYDDGLGMSKETLDEALRLGSDIERAHDMDLGKAGLGLKTAGSSIARKVEVYTKRENETAWYSDYDGDLITSKNEWVKHLQEVNAEALSDPVINLANEYIDTSTKEKKYHSVLSSHGTLVVLSNCDRFTATDTKHFEGALRNHLGETFRKFLANRNIYINGKLVEMIDPLCIEGITNEAFSGDPSVEKINMRCKVNGKDIKFLVKVSILPDEDFVRLPDPAKKQIQNQGFYFLRNQRQVQRAVSDGIFTGSRHNDYNRARVDVYFSGIYDEDFGINFTKTAVNPQQQILQQLKEQVFNVHYKLLKQTQSAKQKKKRETTSPVKHEKAEYLFTEKDPLLHKPKPQRKKESSKAVNTKIEEKTKEESVDLSPVKFKNDKEMGIRESFFKATQVGGTTTAHLNVQHPFYQAFIDLDSKGREPLELLIGSMALCKMRLAEDESKNR